MCLTTHSQLLDVLEHTDFPKLTEISVGFPTDVVTSSLRGYFGTNPITNEMGFPEPSVKDGWLWFNLTNSYQTNEWFFKRQTKLMSGLVALCRCADYRHPLPPVWHQQMSKIRRELAVAKRKAKQFARTIEPSQFLLDLVDKHVGSTSYQEQKVKLLTEALGNLSVHRSYQGWETKFGRTYRVWTGVNGGTRGTVNVRGLGRDAQKSQKRNRIYNTERDALVRKVNCARKQLLESLPRTIRQEYEKFVRSEKKRKANFKEVNKEVDRITKKLNVLRSQEKAIPQTDDKQIQEILRNGRLVRCGDTIISCWEVDESEQSAVYEILRMKKESDQKALELRKLLPSETAVYREQRLAEERRAEEQRVAMEKRAEEQRVKEQRIAEAEKQRLAEKHERILNEAEQFAEETMYDVLEELVELVAKKQRLAENRRAQIKRFISYSKMIREEDDDDICLGWKRFSRKSDQTSGAA